MLHLIFEASDLGIVVVNVTTETPTLSRVNQAYCALSDRKRSDLVGQPLRLLDDGSQPAATDLLMTAIARRKTGTAVVHDDNRWLEITVAPMGDANRSPSHLALFHRDVTQQRRIETALSANQRHEILGRLTAGVAHDFNNVLSAIMAYTDFAADGLTEPERLSDLKEVADAAERGSQITRQLLSFTNYRGHAASNKPVDLTRVIEALKPMLVHLVGPHVSIEIRPYPETLFVLVTPQAVEQVLLNLVCQTCEGLSGGTLTISFERPSTPSDALQESAYARMVLSEQSSEAASKFCVEGPDSTRALAACRQVVAQFGGNLNTCFTSEDGRSFAVDFPLSASSPTSPEHSPSESTASVLAGTRCLLVEDGAALRSACSRALREIGFQVIEAPNAEVALREIHDIGPTLDLVICDMILPGKNGAAVLQQAKEGAPQARFLAITGAVDSPSTHDGVEVLWKPFSPTTLVRRALDVLSSEGNNAQRSLTPMLPLRTQRGSAPRGPSPVPLPDSGVTQPSVLLVEDDEVIRRGLSTYLTSRGFSVFQAGTGAQAIELHQEHDIDLVVVDLHLPDTDGLTVLTAVRDRDPLVPTLVLTGDPSVLTAQRALRARVSAYLTKPISPSEFVDEVDRSIKEGQIAKLQRKLLLSKVGDNSALLDLETTSRNFDRALETLYMVYQPIVRAHDSSIFAFEALMRFKSDSFRHPGELLAAADTLGRMEELGRAVRKRIATTIRENPERNELFFVNLHPMELRSDLLAAEDEPLLEYASRVVLEVTERAQLETPRNLPVILDDLQDVGYRIALDDLGEGYAGLSWLVKLTPDIAKLDMSLVRDIDKSRLKRELVASMVGVCRRARTVIVAEGIETAEEAAVLRDLGCDLLQGYHFAKPGLAFPEVAPNT